MTQLPRLSRVAAMFIMTIATHHSVALAEAVSTANQDLKAVRTAAEFYLNESIHVSPDETVEITVGHIDSRLHLPACHTPLDVSEPANAKRHASRTLLIKCIDKKAWQLYLSATVKVFKPVLVASESQPKGALLSANNVQLAKRDINQLSRGYYTDSVTLSGKVLSKSVTAGTTLTPQYIVSPILIKRGQKVALLAVGHGIEVRHKGIAMQKGAQGEMISVKNLTSKRTVDGMVVADGVVKIQI